MQDLIIIPWVEKYRPLYLKDVVGNNERVNWLKSMIKQKHFPHIILEGLAGTGKTSTALCIVRELLGINTQDINDVSFLEMNASDERGVDIVRKKLLQYCKQKTDNMKIILLDEADNMLSLSQQVLRNVLQSKNINSRFIFTCNDISRIIEPIRSRCIPLHFDAISDDDIYGRLKYICKNEGIEYTNYGLKLIIENSNGDIRWAINQLQLISSIENRVTKSLVYNVLNNDNDTKLISEFIINCKKRNITKAYNILINNNNVSLLTKIIEETCNLSIEYINQIALPIGHILIETTKFNKDSSLSIPMIVYIISSCINQNNKNGLFGLFS